MTDNNHSNATEKDDPGRAKPVPAPNETALSIKEIKARVLSTRRPISLNWFLAKWLLIPFLLASMLVAWGAHLGANGPDAWYTRLVLWVAGFFGN